MTAATEQGLKTISVPANADLSSKQYYIMTINSSGNIAATGDGATADGVLQDAPAAAGRAGCLCIGGVTKVVLGGTVTKGDDIASDSSGRAVTAISGDEVLGRCLVGGTVGLIGTMKWEPRGII